MKKKLALFLFAIGCSAAFAYPPEWGPCEKQCDAVNKRCYTNGGDSTTCETEFQDCLSVCASVNY